LPWVLSRKIDNGGDSACGGCPGAYVPIISGLVNPRIELDVRVRIYDSGQYQQAARIYYLIPRRKLDTHRNPSDLLTLNHEIGIQHAILKYKCTTANYGSRHRDCTPWLEVN
jgi:hypothetical protein